MKRLVGVLIFAILPAKVFAQTFPPDPIRCPTLPCSATARWDAVLVDAQGVSHPPADSFRVIVDQQAPVIVLAPPVAQWPCIDCVQAPVLFGSFGTHILSVVAVLAGQPDSQPATLSVPIQQVIVIGPAPPMNLKLSAVPPTGPLVVGDSVIVTDPQNQPHSLRSQPNSTLTPIATIATGQTGVITGGPTLDQAGSGQTFYLVDWSGAEPTSWIVSTWLVRR